MKVNSLDIKFKTKEVSKPRLVYRDDGGTLHYSTLGATGVGKGLYQNFKNFRKKVAFSDQKKDDANFVIEDNKLTISEGFFNRISIITATGNVINIPAGETVDDLDIGEGHRDIMFRTDYSWYKLIYTGDGDTRIQITQEERTIHCKFQTESVSASSSTSTGAGVHVWSTEKGFGTYIHFYQGRAATSPWQRENYRGYVWTEDQLEEIKDATFSYHTFFPTTGYNNSSWRGVSGQVAFETPLERYSVNLTSNAGQVGNKIMKDVVYTINVLE